MFLALVLLRLYCQTFNVLCLSSERLCKVTANNRIVQVFVQTLTLFKVSSPSFCLSSSTAAAVSSQKRVQNYNTFTFPPNIPAKKYAVKHTFNIYSQLISHYTIFNKYSRRGILGKEGKEGKKGKEG